MKLKELVQKVQQTVDEYKSIGNNMMPSSMPKMHFTLEQQEKLYAPFAAEIDIGEIINLNRTFWDAGITLDVYHEVIRAVAIGMYMQCKSKDERDGLLNRLEAQGDEIKAVNDRWNRVPKGKYIDNRLGTFDKVEFIQKFGAMYNSTDEANADANDKSGICPLLMSVINSGWNDFMAVVENGKVVVKQREAVGGMTASMMLISIKNSFSVLMDRKDAQYVRDAIKSVYVFDKVRWRSFSIHGSVPISGELFCTKEERRELIKALMIVMTDENLYPQDVYDFRTYNANFIKFVMTIVTFIDRFDETQTELCRHVVDSILDAMEKTSRMECRIVKEQQAKDPVTGMFLKQKFDTSYLVYSFVLASMLDSLKVCFKKVHRINDQPTCLFNAGRQSDSTYKSYAMAAEQGQLEQLVDGWKKQASPRYSSASKIERDTWQEKLDNVPQYEQWYQQDKDYAFIAWINDRYIKYLQTKYYL